MDVVLHVGSRSAAGLARATGDSHFYNLGGNTRGIVKKGEIRYISFGGGELMVWIRDKGYVAIAEFEHDWEIIVVFTDYERQIADYLVRESSAGR